jgi:hypothetical protein
MLKLFQIVWEKVRNCQFVTFKKKLPIGAKAGAGITPKQLRLCQNDVAPCSLALQS